MLHLQPWATRTTFFFPVRLSRRRRRGGREKEKKPAEIFWADDEATKKSTQKKFSTQKRRRRRRHRVTSIFTSLTSDKNWRERSTVGFSGAAQRSTNLLFHLKKTVWLNLMSKKRKKTSSTYFENFLINCSYTYDWVDDIIDWTQVSNILNQPILSHMTLLQLVKKF